MGLVTGWFHVFAQSRKAITSPQTRRLAMWAPLVAVAFTAARSWHRRSAVRPGGSTTSTPHGGVLVIVARHREDLYDELSRACQGSSDIRVILDRRDAESSRKGWRQRTWRGPERRCPQPDGDWWASSGVKVVVLPARSGLRKYPHIVS